jgi:flagellar hook-basal body complex protein FliE
MNHINPIGPLQGEQGLRSTGKTQPGAQPGQSFAETLKTFMNDVNEMQNKADVSIQKMAAGERWGHSP